MAGILSSLLPSLISGVGSFVGDIAQGKDFGESLLGGIGAGFGVPKAPVRRMEPDFSRKVPMVNATGQTVMIPGMKPMAGRRPAKPIPQVLKDEAKRKKLEKKAEKIVEEDIGVEAILDEDVDESIEKVQRKIDQLSKDEKSFDIPKKRKKAGGKKKKKISLEDFDMEDIRRFMKAMKKKKARGKPS